MNELIAARDVADETMFNYKNGKERYKFWDIAEANFTEVLDKYIELTGGGYERIKRHKV